MSHGKPYGWQVKASKIPMDYGAEYFPRKFYYKADAGRCLRTLRERGGDGHVERFKYKETR